uniref:Uncharacterized protein n=1 Tax=Ditylenchus dipsaci TaxID=166011 RepID=A0A915ESU8_9BILA
MDYLYGLSNCSGKLGLLIQLEVLSSGGITSVVHQVSSLSPVRSSRSLLLLFDRRSSGPREGFRSSQEFGAAFTNAVFP